MESPHDVSIAAVRALLSGLFPGVNGRIEPLLKGGSEDRKFIAWRGDEPCWLIRLSSPDSLERRQREHAALRLHRDRGILCPDAIAVGRASDGSAYLVTSFVAGASADEVLPGLPERTQYDIGHAAGRTLADLHRLPGRVAATDWADRRARKYQRNREDARRLGVTVPDGDVIDRSILERLPMLRDSEMTFQHDDFHPGNLIVRDGAFAGVIDFNRCDEGDPLEDFYKIPWFTAPLSPAFARGQIAGYDPDSRPRFWERYHLFLAMSLTNALVWIRQGGRAEQAADWDARVERIVAEHDFERATVPGWCGG
jgi:aminoglycoside phosphotransferase (APT) family kinase protein